MFPGIGNLILWCLNISNSRDSCVLFRFEINIRENKCYIFSLIQTAGCKFCWTVAIMPSSHAQDPDTTGASLKDRAKQPVAMLWFKNNFFVV